MPRIMQRPRYLIYLLLLALGTPGAFAATISVPGDALDLQAAITLANDGDTIELGDGTHAAPVGGFRLENNAKDLTIKAAMGATPQINGGGSNNLLFFGYDSNYSGERGVVTFEGITFLGGRSDADGIGAAVTMLYGANATFKNCTFQGNFNNAPSTGGGGMLIGAGSTAFVIDSTFDGNFAKNEGAGISIKSSSSLYVHNSKFIGNRTNLPGHRQSSAGGGIHIGDSVVRITNSRFENNQAGYVAGAIFAIGTFEENWSGDGNAPGANVVIANSTFVGNFASRDGGNSYFQPTEGGAVHGEDLTYLYVYASRFEKNYAMGGGAVNLYRATVEVHDSVFLGNHSKDAVAEGEKALGGTFSVLSNDAIDATTRNGLDNRPSGNLTVSNSYVQGEYDGITNNSDVGGCLYVAGDSNRTYGENSIVQDGNASSNSATVRLWDVTFNQCNAAYNGLDGSGVGGAIALDLANITMDNVMILDSAVTGANSSGGGMAIFNQSVATMDNVTLAQNSADGFGAGLFAQGSTLTLSNCLLFENDFSPGVNEASSASFGAALFLAPYDGNGGTRAGVDMEGSVTSCTLSKNVGLAIWDDDRRNGPINDVRFNGNTIYATTFGTAVYSSKVDVDLGEIPNDDLTVAELNALTVTRDGVAAPRDETDKSTAANTAPGAEPVLAKLQANPSFIYNTNAVDDPAPPTSAYLGYAWSGGSSATLNANPLASGVGALATTTAQSHSLSVTGGGGASDSATTTVASTPATSLNANNNPISGGEVTTLSWTKSGTLLDLAMDQGVSIDSVESSISFSPPVTTTYNIHLVTEQGGDDAAQTVTVSSGPSPVLDVSLGSTYIEPGDSTTITHSASDSSNVFFEGSQQPLVDAAINAAPGGTTEYTVQAKNGFGTTEQMVTIHVNNGVWPIATPVVASPTANQNLTTGAFTVSWNSVADATGYYLEIWDADTGQTAHCEEIGPFDNDSSAGKPYCPPLTKSLSLATTTQITLASGDYVVAVRACDKTVSNFQRCGKFGYQLFSLQGALLSPAISQPAADQTFDVSGITFGWGAVNGAAGYTIRIIDRTTEQEVFTGSLLGANVLSTLISLPNGSYRFGVRACSTTSFDDANCSVYTNRNFSVSLSAPAGAPVITAPANDASLTSSTQTLSWTSVAKADANESLYYEVLLRDVTGGTTTLKIAVFDPSTSTIASIPSSTNYQLKVRACQAACGPWSTAVNFSMALSAVPGVAPTVSLGALSGNTIPISWATVTGADIYRVQAIQPTGGPGGGALTVAAKDVSGTSTSVTVPDGNVNILVSGCNGDGCGPTAQVGPVNPASGNPATPNLGTPVAGSYVDGPDVNFSWSRIPGDNGSNTTYRLFVQDLSSQTTALDVRTTNNFYAAFFKAEGSRYDALVIANPGVSQVVGPAAGFNVSGTSSTAPTMSQPAHESSVSEGNIQLGWTAVPGATLYEYFVAVQGQGNATVRGVTPGRVVQVALPAVNGASTVYSGIVRACPEGATCVSGSESGWGPWSNLAGPGVTNFTVTP